MKIVDNLQLKVNNIHVKVEINQSAQKAFSFGFKLDSLQILTTDNQWNVKFFDRTTINESQMYKMLRLKELDIYWNEQNEHVFDEK